MLKKLVQISVVCIIVTSSVAALAAQRLPAVVATVNGEKITSVELTTTLVDWQSNQVLEEIMKNRIIDQAAKKAGVVVTDAQVKARIEEIKKNMREGQDFNEMLAKSGLTMSHLNAILKGELQTEAILKKRVKVTAADLADYRRASHILIRTAGGPGTEDPEAKDKEVKAKIDQAAQEIKNGAKMEDAVNKYSDDTGTKAKGGDLGWFKKGRMVPEFDEKVFSMKVGDVSDPIQTTYGYHIIKLTGIGNTAIGASRKELEEMVKREKMGVEYQKWNLEIQNAAKKVNFIAPKTTAKAAAPKPKPVAPRPQRTAAPAPSMEADPANQPPPPPPAP